MAQFKLVAGKMWYAMNGFVEAFKIATKKADH